MWLLAPLGVWLPISESSASLSKWLCMDFIDSLDLQVLLGCDKVLLYHHLLIARYLLESLPQMGF